MTDEPLRENIQRLVDALGEHLPNDDRRGQVSADLNDLVEASRWLLAAIGSIHAGPYADAELEDLLIELDVHFLEHANFHIESLRKTIAVVLRTFPDEAT